MNTHNSVWILDDDRSIRWVLEKSLSKTGCNTQTFENGDELLHRLDHELPDAIISDIRMPGINGLDLLTTIQEAHPSLPVIIMTAHSDLDSAVASYSRGAFEYLPKPFDIQDAVAITQRALEHGREKNEKSQLSSVNETAEIIGEAPAMQEVFRAIGRLSSTNVSVLITGPSGSGKELVANSIHRHSPREGKAFIALNVAAIPDELVESELFGHEKGAFTGADSVRKGRFEQANGGTLFLDEIGEMPLHLQVKLLRVLQEKKVTRLGGQKMIDLDIRIVAATNKELKKAILNREFREDLYFRLSAFKLTITALTERPLDIIPLAEQFLNGEASPNLSDEVKSQLLNYSWPGNVRELQNVITRALVLANGQMIETRHLIFDDIQLDDTTDNYEQRVFSHTDNAIHFNKKVLDPESTESLSNVVRNSEYRTIMSALENTRSRDQAARLLGISTRTLRLKLQRLRED